MKLFKLCLLRFIFALSLNPSHRNKLIANNLRLVPYFANKYYPGKVTDDLIQEGTYGLIKAADKFNSSKGVKFSTYSAYWIRSYFSVYTSKNSLIYIPKRKQNIVSKPSFLYLDDYSDYVADSIMSIDDDKDNIIHEILSELDLSEEEYIQLTTRLYTNWSYKRLGKKQNITRYTMQKRYEKIYEKIRVEYE